MGRLPTLVGVLIASAWIAMMVQKPPAPQPADAPTKSFSAARAMSDVRLLGSRPHPIGSPENAATRDALVARMAALDLSPEVRPGVGVQQSRRAPGLLLAAPVDNVVGVLPGRDRTAPALAIMAHYDSVPGSPGAADDIMGVAASLEIVRALKAQGVPARDVMLVMTDGEEAGLLGANHFFRRDPLAKRIGLVLNIEARGAGGRAQMFQTSAQNGGLVELFARKAKRPSSSALAVFIYENMPNDTDLTETLAAGTDGLNYAIAGRQFDYHSPTATPANLDQGSLQDVGTQVLAMASATAFAPSLPARAPKVTYNNLFGDVVLAYPAWAGWIVIVVTAALLAVGLHRARRAEPFPWTDLLRGMAGLLFATLSAIALLQFARKLTGSQFGYLEQRFLLAQVSRWEWAVMLTGLGALLVAAAEMARGRRLIALLPLVAGLACSVFGGFDKVGAVAGMLAGVFGLLALGRPVSRQAAWGGVLILGLVLAIAGQILAPTAGYVVAWPLLVAALAAAATSLGLRRGVTSLALMALLAVPTLAWLAGIAHTAFLSLDLMPLQGLPVLTAAFLLWPLAQPAAGGLATRALAAVVLLAGLVVTLAVRLNTPWDARHPQIAFVGYQVDQDAGRTWRIGLAAARSSWTDGVLTADGGKIVPLQHWAWRQPMIGAPAKPVVAAPPETALVRQPDGSLRLTAKLAPEVRTLQAQVRTSVPARIVSVTGVPLDTPIEPGKWTRIYWQSAGDGLDIVIRPSAPGRLELRYVTETDRWPAGAIPVPPRPAKLMPWDASDATFVTGTRAFTW